MFRYDRMTRYDLILLFALLSGAYYVWDEATASRPEDAPDHLPVLFSVDASPQTAAGLVQGLIKANSWCHVPVGARQAWDFALVDTELNGEAATAVYRLDGAPAYFYRETRRRLQAWDPEEAFVIQNNVQRFAEHDPEAFSPLEGYKIACSDFHLRALRCIALGEACHPCLSGDWALVVEEDTRFNGTEEMGARGRRRRVAPRRAA